RVPQRGRCERPLRGCPSRRSGPRCLRFTGRCRFPGGAGRISRCPHSVGRRDMPLLDHFHPPLDDEYPWDSLHSGWATRLADLLTGRWLPPQFSGAEHTHAEAALAIDVATFAREAARAGRPRSDGGGTATLAPAVWTPPAAEHTIAALFPDTFEVRI